MKLLGAKCAARFKRGEMCVGRNVGHSNFIERMGISFGLKIKLL